MNSEIQFKRTGRVVLVLLLALILPAGCARPMPGAVDVSDDNVALLEKEFEHDDSGGGNDTVGEEAPKPDGGFITLKGRFVLRGDVPQDENGEDVKLPPLPVTKEPEICGTSIDRDVLILSNRDSEGVRGIQNMLLFLDERSSKVPKPDKDEVLYELWVHQDYRTKREEEEKREEEGLEPREDEVFNQKGCRFVSHVRAMEYWQTLHIFNSDPTGHNVDFQAATGGSERINRNSASGTYVTYKPLKGSRKPFEGRCSIHPWMSAYIYVADNPFFALSDENGEFEIKHVPTGVKLEFKLWHEAAKKPRGVIVPTDSEVEFKNGTLIRTFNKEDTDVEWSIEIDSSHFTHLFPSTQ